MTGIYIRDVTHLCSGNILPLKISNYIDYHIETRLIRGKMLKNK